MSRKAIYPGSFDPVTFGHIDVIKRAARVFDEVIVAVAKNISKEPLFNAEERVSMLQEAVKDVRGVTVQSFEGLVIKYAKSQSANVLIRGLRMFSDFEYEFQMALTNRRLDGNIETIFLMPSEGYSFLSSTLIKEASSLGADISSFVPAFVADKIKGKCLGK